MKKGLKKTLYFVTVLVAGFLFAVGGASAATINVNSETGSDIIGDGSFGRPYKTFHKAYTEASANDTLSLDGTFSWTDADETGDVATTGYTITKDLTIIGRGADQTFLQADDEYDTADRRVFTIDNASTTFMNVAIRYGKHSSSAGGGCVYVENDGELTVLESEVMYCRLTQSSAGGGGIYSLSTTTVERSSVYSNATSGSGAGLRVAAGARLVITNSTIYSNTVSSGGSGGAGVFATGASTEARLTNVTVTNNTGNFGGGISAYTSAVFQLKNSLIAGNSGISASNDDFYRSSATITSNGYNIFGYYTTAGPNATGFADWADNDDDDIYVHVNTAATGTLNMDTEAGFNDSLSRTHTYALLSGSIAINSGTTTAHLTLNIPSIDQREANRVGAPDIGAFELSSDGLTIVGPFDQASNVVFGAVQYNQFQVNWTNGSGSRRVVFMKQGSTGTTTPADGTRYSASPVFGQGDQIGSSGWYAIYDGISAASTTITGLSPGTSYIVQVFEYNGIGDGEADYNPNTGTNNPLAQSTYTPITIYVNSTTGDDGTGNGSTSSPYKTFHFAYTSSTAGDTIDLTGTFDWDDASETGDVSTSGYTIEKDVIILGQGPQNTFIQAASSDDAADRRVFTFGSGVSSTLQSVAIRYGKVSASSGGGCLYQPTNAEVQLRYVEMYNCRSTHATANGGGLLTLSTTTIENSTIRNNHVVSQGGGISASNAAARLFLTNSTLYENNQSNGSGGGAGLLVSYGIATLTNVTIASNTGAYGGGISIYNSATLNIKNSIVAANSGNSAANNDFYKSSGTITSGGYNIIGSYSSFGPTTGDWTDTNRDDIFDLTAIGTTGTIKFAESIAQNVSLYGTQTLAMTTGSIAIDTATTSAHNSTTIPTTDQRGASRVGATDIGAYELSSVFGISYTVTYSAGSGGSITGSSTQNISFGADATTVTATPSLGFDFVSWSDGVTTTFRTDTNVTGTISISASFTTTTFSLTYTAGAGGSISGSVTQTVDYNTAGTAVTAVADSGFSFVRWSDNETANPRTDSSVTADVTVSAVFEAVASSESSTTSDQPISTKAPAAVGAGEKSIGGAKGQTVAIGEVLDSGTNVLTYIASPVFFEAKVSSHASPETHSFEILTFDLLNNIVTISIQSEPQTISLSLDETAFVDLDADSINDVSVTFEDVKVNRAELTFFSLLSSASDEKTTEGAPYEGTLIKYGDSPKVFRIENGKKRWIVDENAFNYHGYDWNEIQSIDAVISFEDGEHITAPSTQTYTFTRFLTVGSSGGDVRALQIFLNEQGFLVASEGPGSPGNETAYFGSLTKAALAAFQKAHDIAPAVGYFGPITMAFVNG